MLGFGCIIQQGNYRGKQLENHVRRSNAGILQNTQLYLMTFNLAMTSCLGNQYPALLRVQKCLHNLYKHPRINIVSALYTSPQVDLWICHKTSDQSDANYDSYFWKQANDAKSHASFSVPYTLSHEERREAISN